MPEYSFPSLVRILLRNPKRSPEAMREESNRQLRRLIHHAYEHVPFYHDLWRQAGFFPDHVGTRDDLTAIPMINKDIVVEAGDRILDRRADRDDLDEMSTSGTSGRAITIRRVTKELRVTRRSYLRSLLYNGVRPWHRTVTMASGWLNSKQGKIVRRIAKTRHIFPSDSIDEQLTTLREFRAEGLIGQTGGLYLLARELLRRGESFPLRLLAPTGATLMPDMRRAMREAFKTEPRDLYGAVELGTVSWQCRKGNYHIDADRMIVEIVDEHGKPVPTGETGQVVCTDLYGYTMPLIRYRLLDVASLSTKICDCGIRFPLMGAVQGRINDFLPTPAGDLVSPHYLYHIFDQAGSSPVKEWRIIQHARDDLTYEYVPEDNFSEAVFEMGMEAIRERFGSPTRVRAVRVDRVPMTPNGKRTCIVSELSPEDFSGMRPWDRAAAAGMSDELTAQLK